MDQATILKWYEQFCYGGRDWPPMSIVLELAEGCNRSCRRCPASSPSGNFMKEEIWERVARELAVRGWGTRVILGGQGEPTLNPMYALAIYDIRAHHGKASIELQTNLIAIRKTRRVVDECYELFEAGLNCLTVHLEKDEAWSRSFVADRSLFALAVNAKMLYAEAEVKVTRRFHSSDRTVMLKHDVDFSRKTHNQGGRLGTSKKRGHLRCVKPFREMYVAWNGDVYLCGNDWDHRYRLGSLVTNSLDEVWNGDVAKSIRRVMFHDKRKALPGCAGCDYAENAVALPDPYGQRLVAMPTDADRAVVASGGVRH